ncbi:MAG: TVP38/TMEM64 family protein [Spirochaetota bacterium]
MKKQAWVRIGLFVALVVLGYLGYRWFIAAYGPVDWGEVLSSRESVQAFFDRFDPYVPLAYVIVQAGQVVLAPIPGNVTSVAGGAIFGLWEGFGLSTLGLVIGSVVAFGIARYFGRPLVESFVKPETIDKYIDTVARRHFALLLLIFLFPFFPDDALCLIAGISALPFHVFLLLVVIGRPPGMFVASLVGSGIAVVPWWGWVIIAAVSGVALYFAYRYKDVLDEKLGLKKDETGAPNEAPSEDSQSAPDEENS